MKTILSSAAIVCLTVGAASAATLSYNGAKSGAVGNSQAGASYAFNGQAYANNSPDVADAYVRVWGDGTAKLLGSSAQLAALDAKVESQKGTGSLGVLVKACGFNVANVKQSFPSGTGKTYSASYSATFLKASQTFWVSVVPVTFKGDVGGGASMNFSYATGPCYAAMSGGPKAWGSANASAGVDVGGYSLAGVGTTAKLLDTYLRSNESIGFQAGQKQGGVSVDMTPLSANLWAKVLWFPKYVIAQWTSPSMSYTLLSVY